MAAVAHEAGGEPATERVKTGKEAFHAVAQAVFTVHDVETVGERRTANDDDRDARSGLR